ncbi:hypothetical protein [Jidongwangia harbinensis]|uniref:hypothetical protein n=1 Tax=Jidongwangia harbinensis TaxID=2878561 RepID=UPI001CD96E46|nr:hypothetical protein [Jidongwangia harbinensis]MCA2217999.1 hypothetical protein [Jidongwangia harbinensis]
MRRATRAIFGSAVLGGFALLTAAPAQAAPAQAAPAAAQPTPAAAGAVAQYGFAFADQPSPAILRTSPTPGCRPTRPAAPTL